MAIDMCGPLYTAKLSQLRDLTLPPREVRSLTAELTTMLADIAIEPPSLTETVVVVVILRSGLAMMDAFLSKFPPEANVIVQHLGIFRDKKTLQPVEYYNKLSPRSAKIRHAYILDPVIATGGTADAAIEILREWGVERVTFVSVLASRTGVDRIASTCLESLRLVVGAVDSDLDNQGYVQPGLGDIGDRLFGTHLD
ncbi:uracil phosphoribosyltransferase [Capronia epimyces CBS 606.96]|uniref:uracil phosphoribosyltransferase n=1 Tax=Capronia epimyces CBS 606.96 TaxID=1182542 RepID=W9Z482_9EURO|nr:uracil phosphoribosyltransferase [Capronia epimyces CBS 606.96]EXJ89319.1 uracil phosphoribosyltransferase [Capronia epimyces CBS 606.96]